jgi:hypothetical protein
MDKKAGGSPLRLVPYVIRVTSKRLVSLIRLSLLMTDQLLTGINKTSYLLPSYLLSFLSLFSLITSHLQVSY